MPEKEVGVLACSGEECLGGTLARQATRKMLELYPDNVVTLCLPLYVAGGEEEREFAKDYPVIAVDGCSKHCAKKSTEKFSGAVKDHLDISTIIGEEAALQPIVSLRDMKPEHYDMVNTIADEISKKLETIAKE